MMLVANVICIELIINFTTSSPDAFIQMALQLAYVKVQCNIFCSVIYFAVQ